MTKTAAVIIDDWKLPVFERLLNKEKYVFKNAGSFNPNSLTLKVNYEETEQTKLHSLLMEAQNECRRTKNGKMH